LRTGADGTQSYIAVAKTQRENSHLQLSQKKKKKQGKTTEMHKKEKHQMNQKKHQSA
jgi:hypothetical protein